MCAQTCYITCCYNNAKLLSLRFSLYILIELCIPKLYQLESRVKIYVKTRNN